MLGQLVDTAAGPDAPARDRADVDEVGDPARLALGGAQQVRQRRVRDVQQPLEVERDHPVPLLDRGVDDGAEQHHAGVVDHGVQPAELLRRALDGRVACSRSVTSASIASPPISATSASRRSLRRAATATVAPWSASARAVASPIPLLAPVTSATCPGVPCSWRRFIAFQRDRVPARPEGPRST